MMKILHHFLFTKEPGRGSDTLPRKLRFSVICLLKIISGQFLKCQDFPNAEQKERLETLLDEFGLSKIRKSKGIQLSGGERRRTEIARALALKPKFILLDEPFAGVDPIAVEDIQSIVSHLRSKNIGILITDHNVHETLSITDRAYLLFEGRILKSGTSAQLAEDEHVRKVYLGKNFELRR